MSEPDPTPPPSSVGDPGTPEFWARIETVLDALVGVAPDRIDAEIRRYCSDDPAAEAEVRSLLAHLPDPEEVGRETPGVDLETLDPSSLIGRDLGGFKVESVVGRGGHGVVYRAMQDRPRRPVAVKVIEGPSLRFARARTAVLTRFEREVEALAAVDHPGVARILAAGVDGSTGRPLPFLVTEFVEGGRDLVSWWSRTGDFERRLDVFIDVVDAVQSAHGVAILHRDLKPANVLVDETDRAKVIDFGIAGVLDGRRRVDDGLRGGSVSFASPEQLGDHGDVTVRSDVHALGRLLEACLRVRPPSRSVDAAEWRAAPDLAAVAARASAVEPSDRYPTAASMAEDLRRIRRGIPAEAASPGRRRRVLAAIRRHPRSSAGVAVLVVVVVSLIGLAVASWRATIRAEARLSRDYERLESALASEAGALYRERLTIASLAVDDPVAARRALEAIGPERDDLAVRLLRNRFADGAAAMVRTGINGYRIRGIAGGSVLVGSADGRVRLFRRGSGAAVFESHQLPGQVYAVGASADGRSLVAGTAAGTLHHWIVDDRGTLVSESLVLDDAGVVLAVAHHPVDPIAAIVGADGAVRVVDLDAEPDDVGRDIRVASGVDTAWSDLDFSNDGHRLVAAGLGSGVILIERQSNGAWRERGRFEPGHLVRKARFSPDGDLIALGGGRDLTVLEVDGLRIRGEAPPTEWPIWSLDWSPTADRLAIGGWGQELVVRDASSLDTIRTLLGADGAIWSVAWVDEHLLATGEENAAIRWWPIEPPEARSWRIDGKVRGAVFDSHRDVVVADGSAGLYRLRCDGSIDRLVEPLPVPQSSEVTSAGFGRLSNGRVQWFDLEGALVSEVPLATAAEVVDWVVPSADGRFLGAVLDRHRVVVIEVSTGLIRAEHSAPTGLAMRLRWDSQGRLVLPRRWTTDDQSIATEWRIDPADGSVSGPPVPIRRNIRASLDVPGGWLSAMATDDEFSLFRDGGSSAVARADQAHGGGVDHFRIADDGRTVVTAGGDGVIRLWSMPSLEPLLTLRSRPESRVTALSVLDDRSILVGHADGTVRRYEAVPRAANTVP